MIGKKKDRQNKLTEIILFIFLVLFPFGVILSFNFHLRGFKISIHPIDVIAITALIYTFKQVQLKKYIFYLSPFIFSLLLSLFLITYKEVMVGFLYLIRFLAYASLFDVVRHLLKKNITFKKTILYSLIAVSFFVAVFGWIQYFWLPDLRSLQLLGWDDHLYRLAGTFLDPAFTGLILVLGALISFSTLTQKKRLDVFLIFVFLTISLALTYSRASYLALFTGLVYFLKNKKFILITGLSLALFLFSLSLLPRPSSEGVKLERTHSIYAKLQNYDETFKIFSKNPVFGVGFNTICSARVKMFGDNFASHSCYGADSSLLFILATTGLVGFIYILNVFVKTFKNIDNNFYGDTFKVSGIAILVHSQFAGSLFYPWVVGYMAILAGISIKILKD